jgi:hypothetical protein
VRPSDAVRGQIGRRLRFADWDQSRFKSNSVVEKNHYHQCEPLITPLKSRNSLLSVELRSRRH